MGKEFLSPATSMPPLALSSDSGHPKEPTEIARSIVSPSRPSILPAETATGASWCLALPSFSLRLVSAPLTRCEQSLSRPTWHPAIGGRAGSRGCALAHRHSGKGNKMIFPIVLDW